MSRVLLLINEISKVDPNDPALPKGVTPEKIQDGIDQSLKQMEERGWTGEVCEIPPSDAGVKKVEKQLASTKYDCIVIGGAIRLPPLNLEFFEKVLNTVHKSAPECAIAFNSSLTDMADAAARWLDADA